MDKKSLETIGCCKDHRAPFLHSFHDPPKSKFINQTSKNWKQTSSTCHQHHDHKINRPDNEAPQLYYTTSYPVSISNPSGNGHYPVVRRRNRHISHMWNHATGNSQTFTSNNPLTRSLPTTYDNLRRIMRRISIGVGFFFSRESERERKRRMRRAVETRKVGNQRIEEKAPPMMISATAKSNNSRRKLDTIYEDKDPHGCSKNQTVGISCVNSEG